MPAEIYRTDPAVAASYVQMLPKFGVSPDLAQWAESYAISEASRCQWDARYLSQHFRVDRCLNIGGAPYIFEFAMKRENPGANIVTVDLEPSRFPFVESVLGIRVVQGNIEAVGWQLDEQFDCIAFAEVFEHMRLDLLGTLTRIRDLLTPDGIFYLTTPNGQRLVSIFKHFLRGRTGPPPVPEWQKLQRLGHMGHVREYSAVEVREVLSHCGFAIDELIFRQPVDDRWLMRDILLPLRPALAGDIVVVARKDTTALALSKS